MTLTDPKYDIALSFAGEQRSHVGQVAEQLRRQGIRVFYDDFEQAGLWGKDLYEHFHWVYQRAARYCVLFISADYAHKAWPTHERRSAYERALHDSDTYVLPARFDDTELPGLRTTTGYVDLRTTTPRELGTLIIERLDSGADVLHFHSWPASYHGLVWIWVRPTPTTVGTEHDIKLRWGPWRRRVTAALRDSGVTLVTGKGAEAVAVPCQVEVTPAARLMFGTGTVSGRDVLDIREGWTAKPV